MPYDRVGWGTHGYAEITCRSAGSGPHWSPGSGHVGSVGPAPLGKTPGSAEWPGEEHRMVTILSAGRNQGRSEPSPGDKVIPR